MIEFQERIFFVRDSGKTISCLNFMLRSNEAGLSVVIAMFFGGARRGCIMIPESINRFGWTLFQKELGVFLTGEKPRMGGVIPDITGGAGPVDGGG